MEWESIVSEAAKLSAIEDPDVVEQLRAIVAQARGRAYDVQLEDIHSAQELLDKGARRQVDFVILALAFLRLASKLPKDRSSMERHMAQEQECSVVGYIVSQLTGRVLRRTLPHTEEDLCFMLASSAADDPWELANRVVGAVERFLGKEPPGDRLRACLTELQARVTWRQEPGKIPERIHRILDRGTDFQLRGVDSWTLATLEVMAELPDTERACWVSVLQHCHDATSSKPTKRWLTSGKELLKDAPEGALDRLHRTVLPAVGTKAPFAVPEPKYGMEDHTLVAEEFSACLRGLIWMGALRDSDELTEMLGDVADRCFKKIPGLGPRALKTGNACLLVLSQSSSETAVSQLVRLQERTRHRSVRSQIERALKDIAKRRGLTMEDLKELSVPTFGFDRIGGLSRTLGDHVVELEVTGVHATELRWRTGDGKTRKSPPKAVKEEFATELKSLQRTAREIKKLLPALSSNLETHLLTRRSLPYRDWQTRYLDHPLVGFLARRLMWRFDSAHGTALAAWSAAGMVDQDGNEVSPHPESSVSLWHPIESEAEQVQQWRAWLANHEVTQPFKQAYREVYILTDAERATGTYSNRFGSHIIKQHQFKALCDQRRWAFSLLGPFDADSPTPIRVVPRQNWSAELWVDPAPEAVDAQSAAGIYLYLATDQVRFYRGNERNPVVLDSVPPVIFSEIMRDCDLFIGVCSVGNDPAWSDGGPDGSYRAYWGEYAFGALSQTAKTRREVLERLIPNLKIADRCELSDRFLTVRGDLRTYRIHLGSANILMSPNDQYLCIVQGRSKTEHVMLPFEGDTTLSVIISKALMLADDKKIGDATIANQIAEGL